MSKQYHLCVLAEGKRLAGFSTVEHASMYMSSKGVSHYLIAFSDSEETLDQLTRPLIGWPDPWIKKNDIDASTPAPGAIREPECP